MAIFSRIRGFFASPSTTPSAQRRLAESQQLLKAYDAVRVARAAQALAGGDTRALTKEANALGRQWLLIKGGSAKSEAMVKVKP